MILMYSESDIDGAVDAGVMPRAVATAFRNHVAGSRMTPAVDEEHFRLLTGFNDIFVTIAIGLLLAALAQIGGRIAAPVAGALVAVAAWALAEYFTRRRRMALPSIVLMLAFTGGVAATMIGALVETHPDFPDRVNALIGAGIALVTAGAAWLHWRRFMVPITVAAGAVALVGMLIALALVAVPTIKDSLWPLVLIGGVAVFALAMRWDMSDPSRETRRADVAFWLHLAAAPMIAHPIFQMLGVFNPDVAVGTAAIVIALYVIFGFVALAVDRRALLVSSLIYVLYAMWAVVRSAGAVDLGWALTALVIGAALLTLSAFWHPMRRLVVGTLGGLGSRLPPVQTMLPA
jgi:MFS family permease